MKERKFRKQITSIVQDKFQELDVTFAKLLITFRQLHDNIVNHDSRIRQLEASVHDLRMAQTATQSVVGSTILKNHKLKRQLRHVSLKADFIFSRTAAFQDELTYLKDKLIALRNDNTEMTDNAAEKTSDRKEEANKINGAAA
ncbi:hypothetical protein [Chitinophaga pinensis]|uniref:Uncharacterized protein n=1 Tax=Chitinophaga pinensis TaxID=79329 RepID=A0A5C6LM10_9BACT|nr:hypothetical protein [Chitinophaga pinensis]TWV93012.1 hypothetical protein FEF09_27600 [Chitinophaga pinensis]